MIKALSTLLQSGYLASLLGCKFKSMNSNPPQGVDPSQMDTLVQDVANPALSGASLDGVTFEISDEEDEEDRLASVDMETVHYEAMQDEEPNAAPESAHETLEPSDSHPAEPNASEAEIVAPPAVPLHASASAKEDKPVESDGESVSNFQVASYISIT